MKPTNLKKWRELKQLQEVKSIKVEFSCSSNSNKTYKNKKKENQTNQVVLKKKKIWSGGLHNYILSCGVLRKDGNVLISIITELSVYYLP